MAGKINDGGPAFPIPIAATTNGNGDPCVWDAQECCLAGMSLRDYFAAKVDSREHNPILGLSEENAEALNGTKIPDNPLLRLQWWAAARAAWRYMEADAMIAASEGGAA